MLDGWWPGLLLLFIILDVFDILYTRQTKKVPTLGLKSVGKLDIIWKIVTETVFLITNHIFDFQDLRKNMILDLVSVKMGPELKSYEKLLIYVNTVANYCIWKERNEIKFNSVPFIKSDNSMTIQYR